MARPDKLRLSDRITEILLDHPQGLSVQELIAHFKERNYYPGSHPVQSLSYVLHRHPTDFRREIKKAHNGELRKQKKVYKWFVRVLTEVIAA